MWQAFINNNENHNNEKFTYNLIKNVYLMENYLTQISNPAHRAIITKLRTNAHKLRIHSGAYENKGSPIPKEERICMFCHDNVIEKYIFSVKPIPHFECKDE